MIRLKKIFYLLFYKLYRFCEFLDVGVSDISPLWKAFAILCFFEALVFIILYGQIDLAFGGSIKLGVDLKAFSIFFGLLLSISNYFIFIHYDKWKLYIYDFDHMPKLKKKLVNLAIIILMIVIFFLLIFTFYQYSQKKW